MPIKTATLGSLFFTRNRNSEINLALMLMGEDFTLRGSFPPLPRENFPPDPYNFSAMPLELSHESLEDPLPVSTRSRFQISGLNFDALFDNVVYDTVFEYAEVTFTISSHNVVMPRRTTDPVISLSTSFSLSGDVKIYQSRALIFQSGLTAGGATTLQLRREQIEEGRYVYKPYSILYTIDTSGSYNNIFTQTAAGFGIGFVVGFLMPRPGGR